MNNDDAPTLSNSELVSQLKAKVSQEKNIVLQVLCYLEEIQRRRVYLEYGCTSLFQFCMKELGYTEAESQLRISAMRVVSEVPEIKEKVANGTLSLTAVSRAQSFFREKTKLNEPLQKEEKLNLLSRLEHKSTRECERELAPLLPNQALPKEKIKIVNETHSQMTVNISNELKTKLDKIRSLLSHRNPSMTQSELLEFMADIALEKLSPTVKAQAKARAQAKVAKAGKEAQTQTSQTPQAPQTCHTRVLQEPKSPCAPSKQSVIREVWIRDQERCTHVDPKTNERCQGQFQLEVDHIWPKALGGKDSKENLRILCRAHNQWAAVQIFGKEKMNKYFNRDRSR